MHVIVTTRDYTFVEDWHQSDDSSIYLPPCPTCHGSGEIDLAYRDIQRVTCPDCAGLGIAD